MLILAEIFGIQYEIDRYIITFFDKQTRWVDAVWLSNEWMDARLYSTKV